ncbi:hypothetical protein HBI56_160020 [Parastagonospora nodorum]|uniref:Uncharacterized protein n=1 Tax=Phaeosphaeria nodorum (strain SN15 / ATCC MYA-4574 / FGSC 10173) TaxID=321614 RepID=A0A7U2EWR2_PHANO|nr:hypothetical protein HBH56_190740 [Parastagonospora nodorum]QRC92435.1 hypothetical protein JI435_402450 [Parastagonospora nodorum SN15]KAH3925162.1 hypothetical protein HBH54_186550 [Parastagonospora nodorum]KAH3954072.1 hypothetical protein HBH53_025910 [Parastagonospora nodorum]KAH3963794.1 hypothetical protein HBH51_165720 [Parastagonospora nodorum]
MCVHKTERRLDGPWNSIAPACIRLYWTLARSNKTTRLFIFIAMETRTRRSKASNRKHETVNQARVPENALE